MQSAPVQSGPHESAFVIGSASVLTVVFAGLEYSPLPLTSSGSPTFFATGDVSFETSTESALLTSGPVAFATGDVALSTEASDALPTSGKPLRAFSKDLIAFVIFLRARSESAAFVTATSPFGSGSVVALSFPDISILSPPFA